MKQNIGKGELYTLTYFNIDILTQAFVGKLLKNLHRSFLDFS